ncbi:MAG: DUF1073 domain-containing protein [Azoarcus sp.]|jgi:phage-related protein (TIGR01555 family)|nr:DUF1073 domain-containing protein [Azoarcus sp.]
MSFFGFLRGRHKGGKDVPAPVQPRATDPFRWASTHRLDDTRAPGFDLDGYLDDLASRAPMPTERGAMDDIGDIGDSGSGHFKRAYRGNGNGGINNALAGWYANQGFIGHQLCAMLAQNWLINKACSRPAEDAIRNGHRIVASDGSGIDPAIAKAVLNADKAHNLRKRLFQFLRAGRVFGMAIAVFRVEHDDPDYYRHPFNPDAVKPGSYRGISIVEPYWCAPQMSQASSGDPADPHFYEPEWWMIGGRLYHRSHLAIFRQDEVADILKPSYFYGGVPIPQKILERVYAAERTANEAPALAMNKRTTVYLTDAERALANREAFEQRLMTWVAFRDNHAIKVADKESEDIKQFDTTLTDFDEVMMSQYQLVAAAADVPATKLLGTTPKGFNATGEYDAKSYHETLESIQEVYATPFLEHHYRLLMLSEIGQEHGEVGNITIAWNPTDSPTAREQAEIRKMNAETDVMLADAGVIEAAEIRQRLTADEDSGYANLKDPEAELADMAEALEEMGAAFGLVQEKNA